MSRKHGQELKPKAGVSFISQIKRAQYWQNRLAQETQQREFDLAQSVSQLGSQALRDATQFPSANIQSATLESPQAPYGNNPAEAAGLQGGVTPPPPPGR